jgi:alkylhydroperoxidase family enzyme
VSRTAEGQQAGLTDEKIAKVFDVEASDLSERERVALAYAERMIQAPQRIDDAFFASVRRHFTDAEIADIGYTVLAYSGMHRFLSSIGHQPLGPDGRPLEPGQGFPLAFSVRTGERVR